METFSTSGTRLLSCVHVQSYFVTLKSLVIGYCTVAVINQWNQVLAFIVIKDYHAHKIYV